MAPHGGCGIPSTPPFNLGLYSCPWLFHLGDPRAGFTETLCKGDGEMNAYDLMTPNPQVLTGDEPVSKAARIMRDLNVGVVPIVDDRAHLHPRGVITDRDIAVRCVAERLGPDMKVNEFMSGGMLVTVAPDDSADIVVRAMEENQVRRVLVVQGGRLVGIIAQADLALREGPLEPLKVEAVLERISAPSPTE
jgi:CBS domain-containing protein